MLQSDHGKGGAGIALIDPALLRSPIDYLHAVHLCKRDVCAVLERIAERGQTRPEEIEATRLFLAVELPVHLEDEEKDLFPLLRLRCDADDDIASLLDRLQDDHRHVHFSAPRVIEILSSAEDGVASSGMHELRRFADHARRHVILENAVLMPFARLRLVGADLDALRLSMKRRRGLES